jgi:ABC-type Fe3+/spermidine/putrescine transport system ATPase subunit
MAARLTVERLTKRYDRLAAVDSVSIGVEDGEFLALLGPSGCGKTTLLRLIAGFILPDEGCILSRGKDVSTLPPYRRNFGVVFQNYALFPHMTVLENVGYGLKVRGRKRPEIAGAARAALDRVGLSHAEDRFPSQLSGGQQQRVALARAIVIEPELLLLDEPLSALDKNLREEMQVELRLLQQRIGITTVFVTHDQEEAMTLSDRIAVMRAGRIQQVGTPRDVYDRPDNMFVATFLGTTNLLPGRVCSVTGGFATLDVDGARVAARSAGAVPGQHARLAVRPENLRLAGNGPGLPGTIKDVLFQGHRLIVLFATAGGLELRAFCTPNGWSLAKGDTAFATWPDDQASIFDLGALPQTPQEDGRPLDTCCQG